MLSLNLTDYLNALFDKWFVSVFKLLIEPLLLLILALIVTFWKMFYLPSIFVELLLLDGVMNYVMGVADCLLIVLTVVVSEIIFGDVILMLLLLLLKPLILFMLLTLLLLFLSDDLNVILVIDNLFELLLLLFDPYLDLELELKLEFKLEFIFELMLPLKFSTLTTGLNVSAANDYLHSFSSLLLL